MPQDAACILNVACPSVTDVSLATEKPPAACCLTITAEQTHQLVFPEGASFKAEQCHELLSRTLALAAARR